MCKTLIRRQVGTAHNFANKPVFFACNGVQMRRSRAQHGGRDKGKGAEATSGRGCAPWGNIRGGEERRKDDESKRFGVT